MLEEKEVVVLYDTENNQFKIFVEDGDQYVQRLVFDKLHLLTGYNDHLQLGLDGANFVTYSRLKKTCPNNNEVEAESGKMLPCAGFRHFLEPSESLKDTSSMEKGKGKKEVKVFISYAHEDKKIKDELVGTHLKAIQNHYYDSLVAWTDAEIKPGSNWDNKIKKEMAAADIIIFLITPKFLASDYIRNTEMKNALERFKEKKQIILPIYIEGVS